MDTLPNEILEHIIMKVDGVSLVMLKRACQRIAVIVRNAERFCNAWQLRCLSEISEDVLAEISSASCQMTKNWEEIYARWYGQRMMKTIRVGNFPSKICEIRRLDMFDSKPLYNRHRGCTCIKISGDRVLTSHSDGSIYNWYLIDGSLHGRMGIHKRTIVDMVLVDYYNIELRKENVMMAFDHHHVLTVSKDYTMKSVPLVGHRLPNSTFTYRARVRTEIKQARVFENKIALLCGTGKVELLEMNLTSEGRGLYLLELMIIRIVTLASWPSSWMSFWNDKVIVLQPNLDRYCVSISCREEQELSCFPSLFEDLPENLVAENVMITACNMYRENIIILHTTSGHVCVAVNGFHYKTYATMKDLGGVVTCTAIKGNLLFLGTDSGGLYLYHFEDEAELLELQLDEPLWSGTLGSDGRPVSLVDIDLRRKDPVLVASDNWSLLIFRWTKIMKSASWNPRTLKTIASSYIEKTRSINDDC